MARERPVYPRAPQFGEFADPGVRLGFQSRGSMGGFQGRYDESVPLQEKQRTTDEAIRSAMRVRLEKLPFDKLESIARALLKQQPPGKRGQKRQEALDKFIVDKAKTPAIIELIVDALGLVAESDDT